MTELEAPALEDSAFSHFLGFELLLEERDRELLCRVRGFMTREVEPGTNVYWTRAEFPHELLPGIARLGVADLAYDGRGCPGRGALVDGMVAMKLVGAFALTGPEHGSDISQDLSMTARRDVVGR